LNEVLDLNAQDNLKAVALQLLRQQFQSCEPSTQVVLSQLLSEKNRSLVSEFSALQQSEHVSVRVSLNQHNHDAKVSVLQRETVPCV
ncbi:MAG: hypothetical protein F6K11_36035, partial [Leptolyngbya sp. SIO3F4]|nr:hypothetical protein [Leptolyngbya sp. SIO3F4]